MGAQSCLLGSLLVLGFSQSSKAEDILHSKFPNECFNDKLTGLEKYLPKVLQTNMRAQLCQKPWSKDANGKTLDPVIQDQTQYLTLYDTDHKIPIYSAYIAEPWVETSEKDT